MTTLAPPSFDCGEMTTLAPSPSFHSFIDSGLERWEIALSPKQKTILPASPPQPEPQPEPQSEPQPEPEPIKDQYSDLTYNELLAKVRSLDFEFTEYKKQHLFSKDGYSNIHSIDDTRHLMTSQSLPRGSSFDPAVSTDDIQSKRSQYLKNLHLLPNHTHYNPLPPLPSSPPLSPSSSHRAHRSSPSSSCSTVESITKDENVEFESEQKQQQDTHMMNSIDQIDQAPLLTSTSSSSSSPSPSSSTSSKPMLTEANVNSSRLASRITNYPQRESGSRYVERQIDKEVSPKTLNFYENQGSAF